MLDTVEVDKRAVLLTVSLSSFLTPFASSSFNIADQFTFGKQRQTVGTLPQLFPIKTAFDMIDLAFAVTLLLGSLAQ